MPDAMTYRYPSRPFAIYLAAGGGPCFHAGPNGAERSQTVATGGKWESAENVSNKPKSLPPVAVSYVHKDMVKVDHLLAKEGVAFLAPRREIESRAPEGWQDSPGNNKADCHAPSARHADGTPQRTGGLP
jgi:hypothetical protein